jgi:hypothetical protein
MKTIKTLSINGTSYGLPDGMTAKDIQSLAGFLCTLTTLNNEYDYDTGEYVYHASEGVAVKIAEAQVMPKAAAVALGKESYTRYQAKREAEKAAAA